MYGKAWHGTACGHGGNGRPAGRCKGHGRKRNDVGKRILSGAAVPRQGSGGSPLATIDLQSPIILTNWRITKWQSTGYYTSTVNTLAYGLPVSGWQSLLLNPFTTVATPEHSLHKLTNAAQFYATVLKR